MPTPLVHLLALALLLASCDAKAPSPAVKVEIRVRSFALRIGLSGQIALSIATDRPKVVLEDVGADAAA